MFVDPVHVIAELELQHGSRVADLGAGSGAFSLAAAHAVGESGRIYAVEVQKPMLERLRNLARQERVLNIETLWGDVEAPQGTHLKGQSVDAVIAANVLFQIEDKPAFVEEAKRILKKGGRLLLLDWSDSFGNMGPHATQVVPEKQARLLLGGAGFSFVKKVPAGEHHYGLIFKRA
jgi:ubiquinone/menaquinone biosynthesis C-methylase UbiE